MWIVQWYSPRCASVHTTKYVLPCANLSPQPKRRLHRFSWFCTADGKESLYFTTGRPFSPLNLLLSMVVISTPSNALLLGLTRIYIHSTAMRPNNSGFGSGDAEMQYMYWWKKFDGIVFKAHSGGLSSAFLQKFLVFRQYFTEVLLWPPYVTGQALYFCPVVSIFFLLFLLFFPRLISTAADWMSTILPHMVWP